MNHDTIFPWDNDDLIERTYKDKNYKIIKTRAKTKNAIIFFSGNALYYPNIRDVFIDTILNNDRYEWDNIAKNEAIAKHYSLIIFIRDIHKQWYIKGINTELNTQNKLIDFLFEMTKGYNTTLCGNSAGGYMAALAGLKINAERIFTFSGQFDITNKITLQKSPKKDAAENLTYLSLKNLILNSNFSNNIFYFFPANSKDDIEQYNLIKPLNLVVFKFSEEIHGQTLEGRCYPHILTMDSKKIVKLSKIYEGKIIDKIEFSKKVIPISIKLKNFIKNTF